MPYYNIHSSTTCPLPPQPQRILSSGHPLEIHEVTTPDGYVLQLHRIPGGGVRGPVLLMHGLFSSSGFYVVNRRDRNLPYILAEKGYDVWLGNYRGSPYSLRHVRYSTHETRFWNYRLVLLGNVEVGNILTLIFFSGKFGKNLIVSCRRDVSEHIRHKFKIYSHTTIERCS